ncbi:hypothetical protein Taro_052022, partial [Colocasia esculenta]|nr:hypothetical protein [Colocasia esculenta]
MAGEHAQMLELQQTVQGLTQALNNVIQVSRTMMLHISMGQDQSDERPGNLRCAIGLASAFWRVFPERCFGGSSGGSPRTCLRCFCSSACCSVLSDSLCCLVVGLCILVKVLPRIALCYFWWRFFPGVLCVCFGPPLCCPCGSKCAIWLGCILVRFSQDGSWHFRWRFSPKLPDVVLVVVALSFLLGRCRLRCGALGHASSCGVGQLVSLVVSKFLGCIGGTARPRGPDARGSSSWELSLGRVAEAAMAPCVVSCCESECCELLYPSELRVVFCKSSGSSDPWVAMRTSRSLAGVWEVGSLQARPVTDGTDTPSSGGHADRV